MGGKTSASSYIRGRTGKGGGTVNADSITPTGEGSFSATTSGGGTVTGASRGAVSRMGNPSKPGGSRLEDIPMGWRPNDRIWNGANISQGWRFETDRQAEFGRIRNDQNLAWRMKAGK